MPSSSEKQRRFFGLILAIKRGQASGSLEAEKVAHNISESDARDFAMKKKKQGISRSLMQKY